MYLGSGAPNRGHLPQTLAILSPRVHNRRCIDLRLSLSPGRDCTCRMSESASQHVPVLAGEILRWIDPQPGQIIADGTLGGGGHTRLLATAVGNEGRVVAVDRDADAVARAESTLAGLPVSVAQANYSDLPEVLEQSEIEAVHGILLDLGLSSDQLADQQRGFSYHCDGPLDLRFDTTSGEPAARLVNRLSAEHLANLIYEYGEERFSRRIARRIVERRKEEPIVTSRELARIVRQAVPNAARQTIDASTRTFQALRIAVNAELKWLKTALERLPAVLAAGGRMALISFHSLEDRLVKEAFRADERLEVLTRKPIRPTPEEIARNPRARSAKTSRSATGRNADIN